MVAKKTTHKPKRAMLHKTVVNVAHKLSEMVGALAVNEKGCTMCT